MENTIIITVSKENLTFWALMIFKSNKQPNDYFILNWAPRPQ